jgi:plasmid stability protein
VKTTLELPDDLMRAVKVRAVHEGKKLKDAVAELIQKGLAANRSASDTTHPKPARLRRGFIPSTKDIEAAIAEGRE